MSAPNAPIPFPRPIGEQTKEALQRQVTSTDRLIGTYEALGSMAQMPQWPALKAALEKMVSRDTKAMIGESDPVEIYRLQGSIRALSHFVASPEDALKAVSTLRAKRDELLRMLGGAG